MAYSGSIKRAQAIKLCELCQDDSTKWRCIDCNMRLCEKCRTSHMKIPVTAHHQIVTIGTPLGDVQKKIVNDNIPCKDHPKKMACLFCRSCDSLICPDCVSSSHKKHNFDSIDLVLDEKLDYLRGIHDKIDANIKSCESKTSEVKSIKSKLDAVFDQSLTNIKQKEQELINAIRQYSKDLQEKVKNERSQVSKVLSKIEQDVNNTKKNLEDQSEELDTLLWFNQGGVIFTSTIEIKELKFDSLPNQVEQFIPESAKKILELFGSLQKISIFTGYDFPEMDFEIIRIFTTDLPSIDQVVTLDETSAWINCCNTGVIRKVDIQDNSMTTSQEISLKVIDMAVTSNNELLLSVCTDSQIKLLKTSGEIVLFMTIAPFLPRGIHVTKDNDVIVGVKEPGNPYTPTDQSQRAVIVYGMDGKQKQRYQYDKDGQRLFTFIYRITTNINQDIIVLDTTSGYTGRVVALNKEGNLTWFYEGHSKINASKKFDPRGIVTTSVGHIIISDGSSHAIHVVSGEGGVLTCKKTTDIGIEWPWGLDTDNKGRLWVGRYGEQTDSKLHIIKLFT